MMDYGWDTSDDEGGMEIDLDAKQEENKELQQGKKDGHGSARSQKASLTEDYDPSEPTDDYDPSEPTKDSDSEVVGETQPAGDGEEKDTHARVDGEVSEYDPANPTLSDEEGESQTQEISEEEESQTQGISEDSPKVAGEEVSAGDDNVSSYKDEQQESANDCSPEEDNMENSAVTSPKEVDNDASPEQPDIDNAVVLTRDSDNSGEKEGDESQGEGSPNNNEDADGRWDSQDIMTQEAPSSPGVDNNEESDQPGSPKELVQSENEVNVGGNVDEIGEDNNVEEISENDNQPSSQKEEDSNLDESPLKTNKSESPQQTNKSESPSLGPVDTDDNTQNSLLDDINSDVPYDVTIDDSDFVLEKEPFEKDGETRDSIGSPWSKSDKDEQGGDLDSHKHEKPSQEEETVSSEREQRHFNLRAEEREELGRLRRQEDIDTRNEEALVDLFREESDPERIEDDIAQPVKKSKKKVGSKKPKKKGKKLKKNQSKKGQSRQLENVEAEDQRFVEIRRDRQSVESREEGELEGEFGSLGRRKSYEERVPLEVYDQMFDVGNQHEDEQREPGEIVEEGKKKGKKRDKKERKKKKSRREVATIEEGNQDEDSQKFPSFLAGFFVQDEGDEDLDDNMENLATSFDADEERTFQKGGKTYRKRHDSGAEDSIKSFDQNIERSASQEMRHEESDHRSRRRHEERRHESRERRHHEVRDTREVRREKENRHGTPRDKDRERERDRDRERSRGERERIRDRDREREREREREVVRERDRDRSRRVEPEERRRRRTRSGSRERRRRSGSAERVRRSRSRDRANRHRRHRSKSRERSGERERERERERSKRRHRDRSRERESERRARRPSHSRSRSPRRRSERASSNKENRDESHRRRRHGRTHEDSESEDRESSHRRHRRQRRERERSSSTSSSSSSSSDSSTRHRGDSGRHLNHNRLSFHNASSDEGESSDVILVEPERIVINLDEEEDPPSRIDVTHANTEDDSTTVIDGESIPPPPELSGNTRGSALIQINPAEPEESNGPSEQEGDATPTRDERADRVETQPQLEKSVPESDYDPAHPTEESEEQEVRAPTPVTTAAPATPPSEPGPVPPDHPPPEEVRPSPPPGPALSEPSTLAPPALPPPMPGAPRPQMPLMSPPFQQQPPPPAPQQASQQQQGLLPFPGAPPNISGQGQRFPPWPPANGPAGSMMPQNNGPPPGFPANQRGLLPTPDTRPMFPVDNSRLPSQFSSLPPLSRPPPPRDSMPQQMNMRPQMPVSAMAPLAQITSLLPALERAKMAAHRNEMGMSQSQMFKQPSPMPFLQSSLMGKGPLLSSSAPNMSSGSMRSARSRGGGDYSESTEVVDMDMSPGEDDCELELPSPNSSDSDRDDRRRRGRRSDSRRVNDSSRSTTVADKGVIQPAVYLKALSKAIEKLTPKGQPQTSGGGGTSSQDKSKGQGAKRRKMEINDDDVPASAVDLTNKEKYLKKLHLQERVIDEVKLAIKPFYSSKKITKEQYKLILRKAVPKVCHSKSGNINPQKIQQFVEAYVNKIRKAHHGGGAKKKKIHPAKDGQPATKDTAAPAPVRQNGQRAQKQPTR